MEYLDINCTSKCIHQKEGKCTLNSLNISSVITAYEDCAHFKEDK